MDKTCMKHLLSDPRIDFSYCMQCGGCSAVCPAASISDRYNPREMMYRLINRMDLMNYPLEECFHCYSCKYICKLGNSVSDIVKVLKEEKSEGKYREHPIYKTFYEKGLCVTPDILPPDKILDWGPSYERAWNAVKRFSSLREIPHDSMVDLQRIADLSEDKRFKKIDDPEIPKKEITTDKIYLFKSCFMDVQYPGATESMRYIFDKLKIDYLDDPRQSSCTGFAYYADLMPFGTMLATNARNFAIAEESGYKNIATACVTSYGVLNECKAILDSGVGEESNKILKEADLKYRGDANVMHVFEVLHALRSKIKKKIKNRFDGLPVAIHYGCHYTKMFRELTIPNSLEDLVSVTGAVPVDYGEKDLCCGMGFSDTLNNRDHSRRIAERKLRSIKEAGAKVVISACPGCQITFDRNQEYIEKKIGEKFDLVYLNYSQLIALAMGADPNEVVGIQTHSNPIEPVLEEFGF